MTPTQPPALLPCPFCSGEAGTYVSQTNGFFVVCENCGAQGGGHNTKEESIAAWSHRGDMEGWQKMTFYDHQVLAHPAIAARVEAALLAEVMEDIAEREAALSALPEAGEAEPFGHYFRDMAGRQHFHTGAIPPPFAQSEITALYTTPQPAPAIGSGEVYGYVTQTAFYRASEIAASGYNAAQIAADKLIPVYRTPPAAVSQPAAMVEGLRELVGDWRRRSQGLSCVMDAEEATDRCADELAAILSAGTVQGGAK